MIFCLILTSTLVPIAYVFLRAHLSSESHQMDTSKTHNNKVKRFDLYIGAILLVVSIACLPIQIPHIIVHECNPEYDGMHWQVSLLLCTNVDALVVFGNDLG